MKERLTLACIKNARPRLANMINMIDENKSSLMKYETESRGGQIKKEHILFFFFFGYTANAKIILFTRVTNPQ